MSKVKPKNKTITYPVWTKPFDGTGIGHFVIDNSHQRGEIRKQVHAQGGRRKDIEKTFENMYRKYTFHRSQNPKAGIGCDYINNETQTY